MRVGEERKIEEEVNEPCKCGLEGEGTVGGGDAKPGCVEANIDPTQKWEKMQWKNTDR